VPTLHRRTARVHVPAAAVGPRPLEYSEVPALRRRSARVRVPVAAVRPRPLEYSEVPTLCRRTARGRIPLAAVRPRPLEYSEVPTLRRPITRARIPIAAVCPRPLQRGQRTVPRGRLADAIWRRLRPRPVQAPRPRQSPHRSNDRRVPRAHPRADVCVAVLVRPSPARKTHPERVAQRTAGQREAERVVLVHHVGDKAEAAPRVEQAPAGGGQRVHSDCKGPEQTNPPGWSAACSALGSPPWSSPRPTRPPLLVSCCSAVYTACIYNTNEITYLYNPVLRKTSRETREAPAAGEGSPWEIIKFDG